MTKYNCTICGAGCYSADETKTICAECERDNNLIEVVRCKDCLNFDPTMGYLWCRQMEEIVTELGYCAWGERRTR